VTLTTPSMRPVPVAAGFQLWRPGSVSRASNPGFSANVARDRLSAMPLDIANLANSRREIPIPSTTVFRFMEGLTAFWGPTPE
jgi:hypothetical protein